jgi:4'-phosphopantetheinyl transferase
MLAPRLVGLLCAAERQRARDLVHAGREHEFIVGRGILRVLLGTHLDTTPADVGLRDQAHGKPELDAPFDASGLQFNLSHSDDWLLWAMSRGREIGIDIERRRVVEQQDGIARRQFSSAELASLRDVPAALSRRRFFELWTCKEAHAKATGLGLLAGFGLAEVRCAHDGAGPTLHVVGAREPQRELQKAPETWSLHRLAVAPGYAAALAVRGLVARPRCWILDAGIIGRLLPPWTPIAAPEPRSAPIPAAAPTSRRPASPQSFQVHHPTGAHA